MYVSKYVYGTCFVHFSIFVIKMFTQPCLVDLLQCQIFESVCRMLIITCLIKKNEFVNMSEVM